MNQKSEYKKNNAFALGVMGLAIAAIASPARSQDDTTLGVYELDAHVVSANRTELPLQQVGSSVTVLEQYDLEKGNDTLLVDALRYEPGLYVRNNGGPGGVFGITTRGLSSNRPTILVNGIDASNPADGEILNLGSLFVANINRVEILKGAQSSLYGADALAGVISIDTLGAEQEEGWRAGLGYGSFETYDYNVGHSGSLGGFSWSVDGQIYESEGHSHLDPSYGPAWADDDTYDNKSLNTALQYQFSEDNRVFLSLLYLDSYSEYDPSYPAWGTPTGVDYYLSERLYLRSGAEFSVRENWNSVASVSYSDVDTVSYSSGFPYASDGDRYKADWVNTVEVGESWTLVAGIEHEIEDNRTDVGDRDNTSAFVENIVSLSSNFDWTLGARYDDNSAYGSETTYRSTFSYRLEEIGARVRGSFGTSFQAPNFYQLFNGFYGNEDLKPESGEGWDLGYEQSFGAGRWFASGTFFGYEVDDKIIWDGTYQNADSYESLGFEAALRYQAFDWLQFRAAYTYSDAEENNVEALRVPRNVASLGAYWSALDGKLGLNLDSLFVSSQFSTGTDRLNGARQDGYTLVNAAATYELNQNYSLWLKIGNLLDENYEEVRGYMTPGTNASGGVRFRF